MEKLEQSRESGNFWVEPEEMTEYTFGEQVTRENFMSFFILSFKMSRGQPGVQQLFFKWLVDRGDLDPLILGELSALEEGCWYVFSENERDVLRAEMDRFSIHRRKKADQLNAIKTEVYKVARLLDGDVDSEVEKFFDFEEIESLSDFRHSVTAYINSRKSSKSAGT